MVYLTKHLNFGARILRLFETRSVEKIDEKIAPSKNVLTDKIYRTWVGVVVFISFCFVLGYVR